MSGPSFDKELMIEACAGALTLWGVPVQIGRKAMRERMRKAFDSEKEQECQ